MSLDRPPNTLGFGGRPLAYVDLEFTGLDSRVHDITEISVLLPAWAARIAPEDGAVVGDWMAWTVKVWPRHLETAEPYALELNGFDEDLWRKEAISLEAALNTLTGLLTDTTLVGHNLSLDVAFLIEAYRSHGRSGELDLKYKIDTTTLIWEHLVPRGLTKGNLHDACEVLQISNEGEHRAFADVIRCRALVDALLFGCGPGTLDGVDERIAAIESARSSASG